MLNKAFLPIFALAIYLTSFTPPPIAAQESDDPVFSGPQVGEALPPLKVQAVFGDKRAEEVALLDGIEDEPLVLFFVHKKTRPAFGLSNALVRYAQEREGLNSAIVYLSDDQVEATKWMNQVKRLFPEHSRYGVGLEGLDGPGAYGLNRNVTLTVLVANEGEITANFALTQPSMQVDAPKILKAMVEASGGGEVPSVEDISPQMRMRTTRDASTDPQLGMLVRQVINKEASEAEVEKAAQEVEDYVSENAAARKQLGAIANRITRSKRLGNYGTEVAQEWIKAWAEKYAAEDTPPKEATESRKQSESEPAKDK